MAQPTPYERDYDFEGFQSSHPTTPLPGDKVNDEFDLVEAVLDEVLARIALLQDDDLALKRGSVGYDQLNAEVDIGFIPPTLWATSTAYVVRSTVFANNNFYRCLVSHTSGTFSTDLAAGKWELVADFTGATAAAETAQAAAEAAQAAAASSASASASSAAAAVTSAANAATSATNAATSSSSASGFADAALVSATASAAARDAALVAQSAALASQTAAASSATAADASATAAATSASEAAASANSVSIATTKAEMMTLLAAGDVVTLASSLTSITLEASDWATFRANAGKIFPRVATEIVLPEGELTADTDFIFEFSHLSALLTIKGAPIVETTLTDIASVSGTSRDYTVVINVADNTGIEVGDYVNLYNVRPLPLLMGDNSDEGILDDRPVAGELYMPILYAGAITASSGGGSAAFGINTGVATLTDHLNDGDLLTFKAQSRLLDTVSTTTATIVGAWAAAIAGSRAYWVTLPSTGTAGTSGSSTTITLTGGAATTEGNEGDVILIDGDTRRVVTINSDTEIVVDEAITVTAGTPYSFLTGAELHWGTHEVTAVGSGTITVKNKSKYEPPVNQVQGGEVVCFKTVLKNTNATAKKDGITFSQNGSISEIDRVAIVGTGTADTVGLFVGARILAEGGTFGDKTQRNYRAACLLGENVGIANWGNPVFVGMGCYLDSRRLSVSDATQTAVTVLEGGVLNARRFTLAGGDGTGLQINGGGTVLCTEMGISGFGGDGVKKFGGAVLTTENINISYVDGMAARGAGGGDFHANEGILKVCGGSGFRFEGSGDSEIQRMTIMCCQRDGIEAIGLCDITATEVWVSGTSDAAGSGHGVEAVGARVDLTGAGIKGSQGRDVFSDDRAKVNLNGAELSVLEVSDGGGAAIPNVSPTPTLIGVRHVGGVAKDGSYVTNEVDDFQAYTASVASTSGTITSFTQSAKFREILGDVHVEMDITITDNGTGASALRVGLPFSATDNFPIFGYNVSTGEVIQGYTNGAVVDLLSGVAAYPVATGERVIVKGSYR